MAYFALIYELVDDYIARRGAFREQHLTLARGSHAWVWLDSHPWHFYRARIRRPGG